MIKPNGKRKSVTQKLEICTALIVFYKMEKVINNFKWYTMSNPRHIQSNCGFCFLGFQFPFLLCNNACWASIVKFYPQIKEIGLKKYWSFTTLLQIDSHNYTVMASCRSMEWSSVCRYEQRETPTCQVEEDMKELDPHRN